MNLSRFQLALNHDDPVIVIKGLTLFREQILLDHGWKQTLGYCGVSLISTIDRTPAIGNLLKSYLASSPQLEELFILWSLPGRGEVNELIVAHMSCLASIFFCLRHMNNNNSDDRVTAGTSSHLYCTILYFC